ncbi:LacI family DNA-binding transcriptional regulator [Lentzea sp. BCCO 10_0798]|uniref:LacI family DNA-binding transcriptional regulator n=1 Tax=Lentzea kristufekii TaxID=3095430 RepID=A0ABU4U0T3_9PSEU|nr:LacI family DNA-binding transcriptional regulator [Lentzea sp. BCCO 10_0798]MDX8054174.1 LacI family DNA-binding transcriptional regulator [Lentzea sp. BCCO 10_0798]
MAVTIRDVALQAQVSVSTVSRALSAPGLVKEATRQRVLDVVAGLGYQPNRAARSLITGRTGNLGIVVPDLLNPFFPSVLRGVQTKAGEAGTSVFFCDSREDPDTEAELVRTMAAQVDGVVLCASLLSDDTIVELAAMTPLVLINRIVPGVSSVLMDSASGMDQVVAHLESLGHEDYTYLGGPAAAWSNGRRIQGLAGRARLLGSFEPNFNGGYAAAEQALGTGATALICYNDLIALGALAYLAAHDVKVPEQISVTGFDDILYATMCSPALTTVHMPTEAAGEVAVDLLASLLDGGPAEHRELPTTLVVRASTTRRPGA